MSAKEGRKNGYGRTTKRIKDIEDKISNLQEENQTNGSWADITNTLEERGVKETIECNH